MNDVKNGHDEKLKELLLQNLFKHYDKNHDGTISFKGIILNIFKNIKYV
jgi:Ca2+-binding EF-hand superfamily protein